MDFDGQLTETANGLALIVNLTKEQAEQLAEAAERRGYGNLENYVISLIEMDWEVSA